MPTVNTKTAPHRTVTLRSLEDLKTEVANIERALAEGTLQVHGNWTAGQICQHIGKFIQFSIDGFDGSAPWIVRIGAQLLFKKQLLGDKPMPRGIQLPRSAASMLPEPTISDAEGIAFVRAAIARLEAGERMTQPSPVFGRLTHEQWLHLHLKHAAMHLGFVEYPRAATTPARN